MTTYVECYLNGIWPLMVPDFRKEFWDARPKWEIGRMESCAELMQPGMVVFDIGAEHGDMTSAYRSWVGSTGMVVPVEPAAHYWPFIRGTFEANDFSPPEMCFVGLIGSDDHGTRPIDNDWPVESLGEGVPDGGFLHLAKNPTAERTTIDQLSTWLQPDAIVLDIEGAEYDALAGASYTLAEIKPLVWASVHDIGDGQGWNGPLKDWYGKTPDDIHRLMGDFGYTATELPYHGEGEHFWLYTP